MAEFEATEIIYGIGEENGSVYVAVVPLEHWNLQSCLLDVFMGRRIEGFPKWSEVQESVFIPGLSSHDIRSTLNRIGCVEHPDLVSELLRRRLAEAPVRDTTKDPAAADRLMGRDILGEDD
jgi:hypothetical protein